ncbi:MAG: hypothetical protein II916_04525 [Oscillospiraceae bacterium]|nr:hypothetical protein [Oscillospiraceae bacterium]
MENKHRRRMAWILAVTLSLTLTACGNGSTQDTQTGEDSAAASQADTGDTTEEAADSEEAEDTTAEEEDEKVAETRPVSEILAEIPTAEVRSATLTEVGKLEGEGIENYGDFLYQSISDEEIVCLDYTGKPLLDGTVNYVDKLGDTGLYVYYTAPEGDFSYCGLMDAQGNVVLGTDAKVGTFDAVDSRFVKAYLPEAVTTDRDNAIYYATSRQFSLDVKDGDVMYSGTVKLYDTQEHKFLENTAQKSDPNYRIGNEIINFSDDDYNTIAVTADDKLLDVEGKSVVGDLITEYASDTTTVYDKDMNKLFTTNCTISEITDTHDFYCLYDSESGQRGIVHKSGTIMVEPKYGTVSYLSDGVFSYYHEDYDKQGLLYADGTELTADTYKNFSATGIPGYFNASTQDDKYELLDASGNTVLTSQDYRFKEGDYFASGDEYSYFVINKKDEPLKMKYSGTYLGNHLLLNTSDKVIYDLVTGDVVMDGFEKAYAAYGYIYVAKDGAVTIFQAQ